MLSWMTTYQNTSNCTGSMCNLLYVSYTSVKLLLKKRSKSLMCVMATQAAIGRCRWLDPTHCPQKFRFDRSRMPAGSLWFNKQPPGHPDSVASVYITRGPYPQPGLHINGGAFTKRHGQGPTPDQSRQTPWEWGGGKWGHSAGDSHRQPVLGTVELRSPVMDARLPLHKVKGRW